MASVERVDQVFCVAVGAQVSVQVDDDLQKTGTTVGEFTMLSSKLLFVGGRPRTTSVPQLTHATNHNFKGCLKQVGFMYRYPNISRFLYT